MTAVEIDEAITRVAKDQFGFNSSDRLKVVNQDGIEFIEKFAQDLSKSQFEIFLGKIMNRMKKYIVQ